LKLVILKQSAERKEIEKLQKELEEENDPDGNVDTEIDVYETVKIPISVDSYNKNMAGVDLFDQKATYYGIQLRSHRWYVKILFHFLEVSMINAYILYKTTCEKIISSL